MFWKIFFSISILLCTLSLFAQQGVTVTGRVSDEKGEPVPGASVIIKGSTRGAFTDVDGTFSMSNLKPSDVLEVSFLGYQNYTVTVSDRRKFEIRLEPKGNELDEVTIVAFGKQKKESVISAIQTVEVKDLVVPSSNLTTAFAGRIAGMISYQTSGEPGRDDAEFFIRGVTTFGTGKVDPLILIDNVEVSTHDLARMHPDDIQSFSILKDATATALYGARGANGVILVTTKEGREGKVQVNARVESSLSRATSLIEMSDAITYMEMANEAQLTRNPLAGYVYPLNQIENTRRGGNPYVYPNVDWMDMLIRNQALNQRANVSVSGGGKVARYYVAGSFAHDNGILKTDRRNNFNNNIDYRKYLLRSNINLNLTGSTEMAVRLSGTFDDNQGPLTGGSDMFKRILKVSPARFPAYYEPSDAGIYADAGHILFGRAMNGNYFNPYADMLRGYNKTSSSSISAQLELKQDFEQWIKGLTGRLLLNTSRNSSFDMSMSYKPFYYSIFYYDRPNDHFYLTELNQDEGTNFLQYSKGDKDVNSSVYGEASLMYNRTFDENHAVSGMLVGIARDYMTANASADEYNSALIASLPHRNLGLSGRFTYSYASRYFAEFNFGYNGSEKFDRNHRWGFFPSFGLGWVITNESFWPEVLRKPVSLLKIRGTYGLVGNDAISNSRFFYISDVNPTGGGSYSTGSDFNYTYRGYSVNNYANPNVSWETSYKTNLGIELGLLSSRLNFQIDLFREFRTNVLQSRADIPTSMGLWATPQVNVGKARGRGIDVAVDYKHSVSKDLWLVGRGNFTYARSEYDYYEEPNYAMIGAPWRSKIGRSVKQAEGYVAERLFIDRYDVDNSPLQQFGEYGPGDIKYKDINGDNVINELDMVPIGYPTTPEINYGFGLSAGYRAVDFSFFFSGSARSSFWIDARAMSPFVQSNVSDGDSRILETGLAQFIADDYWSELSQNPQARWPRLSTRVIENNVVKSTWYMYDNPFLRLKSAEIGYTLPDSLAGKCGLSSCRVYLSGTNLLLFSNFKIWDIELGGNGLNYPLQRVFNLGINLSF
jgi:TonB-linked SusC/RagA family outer membrane protein